MEKVTRVGSWGKKKKVKEKEKEKENERVKGESDGASVICHRELYQTI